MKSEQVINHKGQPCPYKSILCQEGWCSGCQIYQDYQGHQRGREATPDWLAEWEKKQNDTLVILKKQIGIKRENAFSVSLFGNTEHQTKMDAMVSAYDTALALLDNLT